MSHVESDASIVKAALFFSGRTTADENHVVSQKRARQEVSH